MGESEKLQKEASDEGNPVSQTDVNADTRELPAATPAVG